MVRLDVDIPVRIGRIWMPEENHVVYFEQQIAANEDVSAMVSTAGVISVDFRTTEEVSCKFKFVPQEDLKIHSVIIGAPAPAAREVVPRPERADIPHTPFEVRWEGESAVLVNTFKGARDLGNWSYTLLVEHQGRLLAGDPEIVNLGTTGPGGGVVVREELLVGA